MECSARQYFRDSTLSRLEIFERRDSRILICRRMILLQADFGGLEKRQDKANVRSGSRAIASYSHESDSMHKIRAAGCSSAQRDREALSKGQRVADTNQRNDGNGRGLWAKEPQISFIISAPCASGIWFQGT